MCVVSGGGKVGLSFYIVETGHVHVMADTAERDDYSLLKRGTGLYLDRFASHLCLQ